MYGDYQQYFFFVSCFRVLRVVYFFIVRKSNSNSDTPHAIKNIFQDYVVRRKHIEPIPASNAYEDIKCVEKNLEEHSIRVQNRA